MADSENKTVNSLSIQDMHKYQCYSNKNHPLNYNQMSDGKGSTKNNTLEMKFELDRSMTAMEIILNVT